MIGRLLAVVLLAGCSRREPPIVHDPVDPKPKPAPVVEAFDRMLHVGHVIDVAARKLAHELSSDPPALNALDARAAFFVDKFRRVHAVDVVTGKERWVTTLPACAHLALTESEVHCVDGANVHAIDKANGALRTVAGSKLIAQVLGVGRHLIVVRSGGGLDSIEERTGVVTSTVSSFHAFPALVRDGDGFCGAVSLSGAVLASCFSETLTVRWSRTISLARPGDPPFTPWPRKLANGFLLISADHFTKGVERAAIVRLADGDVVARVDEDIAAFAARDAKSLDGLVSLRHGFRYLEPNGTVRFTAKLHVEDAADAVVDGDKLFVAVHPSISVGSEIHAFQRTTGGVLWTATPTLPPIGHSAYINNVRLAVRSGVLSVHGEEAAVDYVLLLDRESGKERLADVVKLW